MQLYNKFILNNFIFVNNQSNLKELVHYSLSVEEITNVFVSILLQGNICCSQAVNQSDNELWHSRHSS